MRFNITIVTSCDLLIVILEYIVYDLGVSGNFEAKNLKKQNQLKLNVFTA